MTTADKIIDLLDRHPEGLTDNQIATHLNLPQASVRRTRSKLEDSFQVFFLNAQGTRMSNRYVTFDS